MKFSYLLFCIGLIGNASAQEQTRNLSVYIKPEKKYLVLPIKNGATKRNGEIWVDGVKTRFFDFELAEDTPDWYAYLQIDEWKGKEIEFRVDKIAKSSKVFQPVQQSDLDTNSNTYGESIRGQIHFSPKRGWTNDPNGMVFYNGEYHLFYQHNPYGRAWGNMTWGHAVTKDLIHWTHLDDAIHPDQGGPVFSGGAVVDSANTSGYGKDGKLPLVAFHTGATGWGQYMSWSTDGRTFENYDKAVVPRIHKDNRDPKVIWHEPSKKWVMVVWVERGDNEQHSMQFLTSGDLKNWEEASVFMGGIGNDRYLFECPEFYELPVDGNANEKKWVLTGANTEYAIGTFDGKTFKAEEQRLQGQHGRDFYAPQTFSNDPTGRRIELGWWRVNTALGNSNFQHGMSLPLEHKLVRTPKGIRLTRTPVKEVESLRGKATNIKSITVKEGGANPLKALNSELAELRFELVPGKAKTVTLDVRGLPIVYNAESSELIVDGVKAPVTLDKGKLDVVIYVDRVGVEIFTNKGLMFMPINYNLKAENKGYSISSTGGSAKVNGFTHYELNSIYK